MMDDDFDLEKFRVQPGQIQQPPEPAKRSHGKRKRLCFVGVPCAWWYALRWAKHIVTYRVALHLLDEGWRSGKSEVPLSNCCLKDEGVSRSGKRRALLELEQLGLIRVERFRRKSPLVQLLLLE